MNQLESLKKFSTLAADTSDIQDINYYNIQYATTNPSIILKSLSSTTYLPLIEEALNYARKNGGSKNTKVTNASDRLIVNIGSKILENISGNISTEIDSRASFNSELTIKKAQRLINMYQEKGVNTSRVLIKIAATWEGIQAAEELEKSGIKCNLTLLFSFAQAQACADKQVYLISPFVGRIYDWYAQHNLISNTYSVDNDPGIKSLKKIYYYYKTHGFNTIIMGASFRSVDQILAITGCDYLTISPNLLQQLSQSTQPIERKLNPNIELCQQPATSISKTEFFIKHNQDKMAVEKLHEGIHQFSMDQKYLQDFLITKL